MEQTNQIDHLEFKDIKSMRVAQLGILNLELWGDLEDPKSNWSLAQKHACFSHREFCEFIFYVGDTDHLEEYQKAGFSTSFTDLFKHAHNLGYKYICIYS